MVRLVLFATLAGCYAPSAPAGAPCGPGDACPSGQQCIAGTCQVAGDGTDACVDRCESGHVQSCGGAVTLCEHGCVPDPAPHCAALAPTFNLTSDLLTGATADFTTDKAVFNTDTGEIRSQGDVIRPAGDGVIAGIGFAIVDEMGVFTANSFTLAADLNWDADGSHPLVLFAATTIAIAGQLDVGASFPNAGGAGGENGGTTPSNPPCRGGAGPWIAPGFGAGGGGGGGATAGGDGGPSLDPQAYGAGGTACERPSTVPLRGGNGGGAGGADSSGLRGGSGGGGGGAVALVALGSITIDGVVGAPGGGGNTSVGADGGGGGGSGGAIFVEAPTVNVRGALTANGGGGAAPTSADGSRGYLASATPASGGTASGASGGRGGAGTTAPTDGGNYNDGNVTVSRGGGGGGSAGVIRVRRRSGEVAGLTSPPAVVEDAVVQ